MKNILSTAVAISCLAGSVSAHADDFSNLHVTGSTPITAQGLWLQWNRNGGDGSSWVLNQKGGGSGGVTVGEATTGNTVTRSATFTPALSTIVGGLVAPAISLGSVTTRKAPLDIEGDANALGLSTPFIQMSVTEAQNSLYSAASIVSRRTGGSSVLHEALHVESQATAGSTGDNIVGALMLGHLLSTSGAPSGTAFGANPVAWVDNGVSSSASAVGMEVDTRVLASTINSKVGIQIVDVSDSTGSGTVQNAGLLFGSQIGGGGYSVAIKVGPGARSDGADLGLLAGGTVMGLATSSKQLRAGIDLSGGVFSQFAFASPSFMVDGGGHIKSAGLFTRTGTSGSNGSNIVNFNWTGSCVQVYIDTSLIGCLTTH